VAYDEDLADRVRAALPDAAEHVAAEQALGQPHVRPMDFTGRPMKGMVFVDPAGLHGDTLRQWVDAAAGYARGLPAR